MHFQSLSRLNGQMLPEIGNSEYKDTHEPSAIRFIILVLFLVLEILTNRHSDKDFT